MLQVWDMQVMRPLLAAQGFHFSKAKGQNFLTAAWVPQRIAEEAAIDLETGVLEIGPGVGALTQQLALRAGKVCAVEVDTRLQPILAASLEEFDNVEILWQDALKLNLPTLTAEKLAPLRPVACANLPYYITTPILTALLEADCFDAVTVMVQREVAQRIAARPGTASYGAFSVFCQYYAQPELLFEVPPECFQPRPKVTSAVVTLYARRERTWAIEDEALFFRTVHAAFAMRRKTLQNCLAAGFPNLGKEGAGEVLAECCLAPTVRGETLDIPTFAAVSNSIRHRLIRP